MYIMYMNIHIYTYSYRSRISH